MQLNRLYATGRKLLSKRLLTLSLGSYVAQGSIGIMKSVRTWEQAERTKTLARRNNSKKYVRKTSRDVPKIQYLHAPVELCFGLGYCWKHFRSRTKRDQAGPWG